MTRFLHWVGVHALAIAAALFFVLPFVFVFLTALMSDQQALTRDLWPDTWHWENLRTVWETPGFLTWWKNTLLYAGLGTALTLLSSIPVAYALARFRFRGRNVVLMLVIATMMLPAQVVVVPMYLFWAKQLHLSGTLWPLIIPMAFTDAFSVFLLRQFLLTIPKDYVDAAAWTLSYGLESFKGAHHTNWNLTTAATLLVMAPVIVLFFFAQKAFIEGVTLTGVKG